MNLDPAVWGVDVFATIASSYGPWGVAVGDLDLYTGQILLPYLTVQQQGEIIGGAINDGGSIGLGQVDTVYGFAWEVDAAMSVQVDMNGYLIALPNNTIDLGAGQIASAWYDIDSLFVYTFN